jgi:hypothetical protein
MLLGAPSRRSPFLGRNGDAVGLTGDAGGAAVPRAEMVNGFNSGWIHFGAPGTEHVDGAAPLHALITQFVTRSQLYKVDLEGAWSMGRRDWPQFGRNLNERSYSFRDVGLSDKWLLFPKRVFEVIATL